MFKKTGDNQPIESFYNTDGEENRCAHCGHKLVVLAFIDDQDVELVCEHCDGKGIEQHIELGE